MKKVTLLGAGSGFTQPLFTDILNIEGLDEGIIGLVDIDRRRLEVNIRLIRRILDLMKKTGWRIEASTDRRRILPGTDYLISTIEVSGMACVRHDNDIPMKYGIDQCIGDTIGPGGIMKALRTLPPFIDILKDAASLCPSALVLNYTNPMSIMTLGAVRTTNQPFVGLCHSVQGNSREIAQILGVPYNELEWKCGGINHMAWFTHLRWNGVDMHGRLREMADDPATIENFPVRTDLIRNLGYFSTESCGHYSEYVPYYRKRKDLIKLHCRPGYKGGSGFYADNWPQWRRNTDKIRREMAAGKRTIPLGRGLEYAADIIEAHIFDRKKVIYASVLNTGLIPNLPQTGVVEVATEVDSGGFNPVHFGDLPEQCAALCRSNMAVFELCVQGILSRNREPVIHAMMMDPLSAAVCSLTEIRSMAEELFAAEKAFIPNWCARPKPVRVVPFRIPFTNFVHTVETSPVLPRRDLATVQYPEVRKLGLKPRTFADGFVNRHEELAKSGSALVYFRCRIRCAADMKLEALFGYDGPVKVWVEGREAYYDPNGTNPALRDQYKFQFNAVKGVNEVLVALDSNGGRAWGIFLRFRLADDDRQKPGLRKASLLPAVLDQGDAGVSAVSEMSARLVVGKRAHRKKGLKASRRNRR